MLVYNSHNDATDGYQAHYCLMNLLCASMDQWWFSIRESTGPKSLAPCLSWRAESSSNPAKHTKRHRWSLIRALRILGSWYAAIPWFSSKITLKHDNGVVIRSLIDFNSIDLGIKDERNETLPECSMSHYAISLSDITLALILSDWAAYQESNLFGRSHLRRGGVGKKISTRQFIKIMIL